LEGDEVGPLHLAQWLEGESVVDAATGFIERLGLPLDPNAKMLEREFVRVREAAAPPPPTPNKPVGAPIMLPGQGFSMLVTFKDRDGQPPAYITYRFGEDVTAVVSAFLDVHGVFEESARAEAVATLTESLATRAAAALEGVGGGDINVADASRDVIAPHSFTLPVSVGELGYDISVPEGASLWAAAHLFCEQQWEDLEPKMRGAVEALFTSKIRERSDGSRKGEVVSQETCKAIVFDLLVKMISTNP